MSAKAPSSVLVTYREQQGRADDPPVAMLLVTPPAVPARCFLAQAAASPSPIMKT
eukprot:CAMPEP_0172195954 /NCGR_PEP_ID=MMETSP1050-20130122/26518_1 /TAXON_ID=233186 /ORGANISM="Cryptomonas curvata, Strain CCAP979/52" /LENGTH=54 /DNA_ID=CAMNT_0012872121 /DNA_START=116 /DNA_END=280 /DNA_ORIENTATION=-